MKFRPCPWPKDLTVVMTPRRIAAARRRLEKEREAVALLPDLVAGVPSLEAELSAIAAAAPSAAAEWREHWAAAWRRARRGLAALPEHQRRGLLRYWSSWSGPASPEYLLTFLHQARNGECFWNRLRELRQYFLIGQKRFPMDRIAVVFSGKGRVTFRGERNPTFYLRRRAGKQARRCGRELPTRGYQMELTPRGERPAPTGGHLCPQ